MKKSKHKIFILVFILLLIPLVVFFLQRQVKLKSKASTASQVNFYFDNSNNLMLDSAGQSLGFVRTEVDFDKSKLKLLNDISLGNVFNSVIEKTDKVTANTTGKIVLVLALSPTDNINSAVGSVLLAHLPFGFVNSSGNQSASVNVNLANTQVVTMNSQVSPVSMVPLTLSLNVVTNNTPLPTRSPSPVNTQKPIATIAPTRSPLPVITPRPIWGTGDKLCLNFVGIWRMASAVFNPRFVYNQKFDLNNDKKIDRSDLRIALQRRVKNCN